MKVFVVDLVENTMIVSNDDSLPVIKSDDDVPNIVKRLQRDGFDDITVMKEDTETHKFQIKWHTNPLYK